MRRDPFPGYDATWQEARIDSIAPLPSHIKTIELKKRIAVDLNEMTVRGDDGRKIALRLMQKLAACTSLLRKAACAVLIHALDGRRKTTTTVRWANEMSLFLRVVQTHNRLRQTNTITLSMYQWYTEQKGPSQVKLLRGILLYWIDLEIPGLASDLASALPRMQPPKTPSPIEIQNRSPKERPFSAAQVKSLLDIIGQLYADCRFDSQDNMLWRLLISEAMRPGQLALLQVGDVSITVGANGVASVTMRVPYVKQGGTAARDYMHDHDLSSSVSHVVAEHMKHLQQLIADAGPLPAELPLFCLVRNLTEESGYRIAREPMDISGYISTTGQAITDALPSNEEMELFSRRLKHTKLTHLAQRGASVEILAAAAFQTSTGSVSRYVNMTEEAFVDMEQAMAPDHDFLIAAFRGKVIDRDEATHSDEKHLLELIEVDGALAACGSNPCGMEICEKCYGCAHFEAFKDGPHEEVEKLMMLDLEKLESRQATEQAAEKRSQLKVVRIVIAQIRAGSFE